MIFIARYIHRHGHLPDYYRTVYGDSVNEATKMAERFARKEFILVNVKQQVGKD